ncbi:MAG: hypothetical protein HYZ28_01090 [Myxococcales bacterium]|nr:hypothetical protein [Myxococcales bacterium]
MGELERPATKKDLNALREDLTSRFDDLGNTMAGEVWKLDERVKELEGKTPPEGAS